MKPLVFVHLSDLHARLDDTKRELEIPYSPIW
jgi:hypothetical protein